MPEIGLAWAALHVLGTDRGEGLGVAEGGRLWGAAMNWGVVWSLAFTVLFWSIVLQGSVSGQWGLALLCDGLLFAVGALQIVRLSKSK